MSGVRFLGTRIVFVGQEKYALECLGDIINLVFLCFRVTAPSEIPMAFYPSTNHFDANGGKFIKNILNIQGPAQITPVFITKSFLTEL